MSEINQGKCAVCKVEASKFCSACKTVKYCGVEHQKQHWKVHKLQCRPFSVSFSKEIGRFLGATRNIIAHSVIFTETPLAVGPKWYLSEREESNPIFPCVGCSTPTRIDGIRCPRCNWPACRETCTGLNNSSLHAVECPILMLRPAPVPGTDIKTLISYYRMDALFVLKCLLLQRKYPKKWELLMDMQSHEVERLGSELYLDMEKRVVSYLMDEYLCRLKSIEEQKNDIILPKSDAETLRKICGIIETNYMCINMPNGLEMSGVFYNGGLMEHSCLPNCYFTFDFHNNFKLSVVSGRNINQGEHLKIMYSYMLWGTQMRQEHLQLTKHFLCTCERCVDPTELGTYFSGLKCMGAELIPCGGIQLPRDPLNDSTEWFCDTCPVRISSEEVRYLMTQMSEEVEELLSKKPTISELEDLIGKLEQFLHPNHYNLFNLKHSLIQLYGTQTGYLSEQLSNSALLKKESLCEQLLSVCDSLDPYTIRLSLYVGVILYERHSVLVETSKRTLDAAGCTEVDKVTIALKNLNLARDYLLRAAEVLKKELDTIHGSKLSDAVIKAISNVDSLITNNPV